MQFRKCKITSELSLLVEIESKHSRSHKTVAQKFNFANYFIQNSINKGAEKFGVERKSIGKWIQQLPELTQVSDKSKTKTLQKGKRQMPKISKMS